MVPGPGPGRGAEEDPGAAGPGRECGERVRLPLQPVQGGWGQIQLGGRDQVTDDASLDSVSLIVSR